MISNDYNISGPKTKVKIRPAGWEATHCTGRITWNSIANRMLLPRVSFFHPVRRWFFFPAWGVVSAFTATGPELEYWLKGKNALCDYLVGNTIGEAEKYAGGRVWSRVIWDVTAVGWLLNDHNRFMLSRLVPTPVPGYDHHYSAEPSRPLCRMVYHIHRDALFADLFGRLSSSVRVTGI